MFFGPHQSPSTLKSYAFIPKHFNEARNVSQVQESFSEKMQGLDAGSGSLTSENFQSLDVWGLSGTSPGLFCTKQKPLGCEGNPGT